MAYVIKVENDKSLRVLVKYEPMEEKLYFFGQIKNKRNVWVISNKFDLDVKTIDSDITTERFDELVLNLFNDLKEKQKIMESLDKIFSNFKTFEVIDVDNDNVYGVENG